MNEHEAPEGHREEAEVILMPQAPITPATMTIDQAATYIGVSKATLYDWRYKKPGFGPVATPLGSKLAYQKADLDDWLARQREVIEVDEAEALLTPEEPKKPADSMTRRRRNPVRLAG